MAIKRSTRFGTYSGYNIEVGNVYTVDTPQTLYPRPTEKETFKIENTVGFQITNLNKAGRRFTCEFKGADGSIVATRRVYREYVEWMIEQLGLAPVADTVSVEADPEMATIVE